MHFFSWIYSGYACHTIHALHEWRHDMHVITYAIKAYYGMSVCQDIAGFLLTSCHAWQEWQIHDMHARCDITITKLRPMAISLFSWSVHCHSSFVFQLLPLILRCYLGFSQSSISKSTLKGKLHPTSALISERYAPPLHSSRWACTEGPSCCYQAA